MQYMNGPEPVECDPQLIDLVLTTAITVHRNLGPGLLESIYKRVMERELQSQGLKVASQCPISVIWKGEDVGMGFRADLIVERSLLLELKAVQEIIPLHIAQVITYLKMTSIKRGFILNFNVPIMKKGYQTHLHLIYNFPRGKLLLLTKRILRDFRRCSIHPPFPNAQTALLRVSVIQIFLFHLKTLKRISPCLHGQPALKYRVNFEGAITGICLLRAFRCLCGEVLPLE